MKMTVYLLTLLTLTFGCRQPTTQNNSIEQETSLSKSDGSKTKVDTGKIKFANVHSDSSIWFDSLIEGYIHRTDNKIIRLAIKDQISEEWLLDQIVKTDTANYFVFQIGHDVADTGETNKRFITDDWIYIDSLTKRIYEYDLENDRLIKWNE